MKRFAPLLATLLLATACDNPIEPAATGDLRSENLDAVHSTGESGGRYLAIQVNDPAGDLTGAIDVRKMRLVFDRETGEYRIVLTASRTAPFVGVFRVNVNLFNPELGTARNPSFFSHTMADFELSEPRTTIVLAGQDSRLTQWEKGHQVFTNSYDGTGNPDGISLFGSSVMDFSMAGLANRDMIAPRDRSEPVKIHGAGNFPEGPILASRLIGDRDGFGLALEEGDVHTGAFDARSGRDPSFTDVMPAASEFTWALGLSLPTGGHVSSAELVLYTLGVQDGDSQVVGSDTDIRLFLDGVEVPGAFDELDQFDWIGGQWASFTGRVVIPIPAEMLPSLDDGFASFRIEILQLGTAPSTDAIAIDYVLLQTSVL